MFVSRTILFPAAFVAMAMVLGASAATVYQTGQAANFTYLVASVDAMGLKPLLDDANLVATVFAPTDEASLLSMGC